MDMARDWLAAFRWQRPTGRCSIWMRAHRVDWGGTYADQLAWGGPRVPEREVEEESFCDAQCSWQRLSNACSNP